MKSYRNAIRATMRARRKAVSPEARAAVGKELSRRLLGKNSLLGAELAEKGLIAVYLASVLAGLLAVFLGYVISR